MVRNVPFSFYGIFCSYVGIIADSAINGFEHDEELSTEYIFAREQTIDAEQKTGKKLRPVHKTYPRIKKNLPEIR